MYAVRTRRIRIPGMNRLATMVNPNYQRMDDSNMVSIQYLNGEISSPIRIERRDKEKRVEMNGLRGENTQNGGHE